jgi:hypothetical protein
MKPDAYRSLIMSRHLKVMQWCQEENKTFQDVLKKFDAAVSQQSKLGPFKVQLGGVARICLNNPDADFWLQRRGNIERVGRPMREATPVKQGWGEPERIEEIGICVTQPDVVAPAYLFAFMEMLWLRGYWQRYARGTLQLQNIIIRDVKAVVVTFDP